MHVSGFKTAGQLGGYSVGFGYLLALKSFTFEHIEEIGISAYIQLVGAVKSYTSVFVQTGHYSVKYSCAYLALDIISHDWKPAITEPLLPVWFACDENRYGVHKCATRIKYLFNIPLRCLFAADRQITDYHVGFCLFEYSDYIGCGSGCFLDDFLEILSKTVVCHTPVYFDSDFRYVAELYSTVRIGKDGFTEIFPDLCNIDIESS